MNEKEFLNNRIDELNELVRELFGFIKKLSEVSNKLVDREIELTARTTEE